MATATLSSDVPVKRIRDLLRLAKSNNPHEAKGARQRADELLRRYRLTEGDVAEEVREVVNLGPGPGLEGNQRAELARVVAKSRNVQPVRASNVYGFVGYPDDAKDAVRLFSNLVHAVEEKAEHVQLDGFTTYHARLFWRTCFWLGFVSAVEKRLGGHHGPISPDALARMIQNQQAPQFVQEAAQAGNEISDQHGFTMAENFKNTAHAAGRMLGDSVSLFEHTKRWELR